MIPAKREEILIPSKKEELKSSNTVDVSLLAEVIAEMNSINVNMNPVKSVTLRRWIDNIETFVVEQLGK
jgi:hypothetical protein